MVTGEAPEEEAGPEPKEAGPKEAVKEIRIEAPGIRMGPPVTPAGSIGFMGRLLGFVLTGTTAHGETTRARGRGTTETLSPALILK